MPKTPYPPADPDAETFDRKVERAVRARQQKPIDEDDATEHAIATEFTRRHCGEWRYVNDWGQWLEWDGTRWLQERTLLAFDLTRTICSDVARRHKPGSGVRKRLGASATVSGAVALARSDRKHAMTGDIWDADPMLLNTPGGTIDLKTGRLRDHNRSDYITRVTTATPDDGHCPLWRAFLHEIMGEDQELIDYLQRVVGYALTGVTKEHALFFLSGSGANGKSVFLKVFATILGDYAATAPAEMFMATRNEQHPTDVARLRGARFVSAVETEEGRRWHEAKLKNLTGGDKLTARFMRQDFFEFAPQFKLLIAGNHKPGIRSIDEAMRRRMHLIPFEVTIAKECRDIDLAEKLIAQEGDAILAWAIDGCLEWQRTGLAPPKAATEATDKYLEDNDSVARWIKEQCKIGKNEITPIAELFASFKAWAERNEERVGSINGLSENLERHGYTRSRATKAGTRSFIGLRLMTLIELEQRSFEEEQARRKAREEAEGRPGFEFDGENGSPTKSET